MVKNILYRNNIIKSLISYTYGVRKDFVLMVLMSLFTLVTSFVTPRLYKIFIDDVIVAKNINMMGLLFIYYLLLFFIDTAFSLVLNNSKERVSNIVTYKIKHKILRNYFRLDFNEYNKRPVGDFKLRLEDDLKILKDYFTSQSIDYYTSIIMIIVTSYFLFTINWILALMSIIIIPISFLLEYKIGLREDRLKKINFSNTKNWHSWVVQSIKHWKEGKLLNINKSQLGTFTRFNHNYAEYYSRWINFWVLRVTIIPKLLDDFFMKFLLYFIGGLLIINNRITIGELLLCSVYTEMFNKQIRAISKKDGDLISQLSVFKRILNGLKTDTSTSLGITKVGEISQIQVKNLTFSYDQSPLLSNISFTINRGDRFQIKGASGMGKSTLLNLICGMIYPLNGDIVYSGRNLNGLDLELLHNRIGFVRQENLLLNRSIKENLVLGCSKKSDEYIFDVCRRVALLDVINKFQDGLNTIIGENGFKLSKGERQRLILARVLLRDVDVIILDEPSSSLDPFSERIIINTLKEFYSDKIVIVVSHRDTLHKICTKSIVL